MSKPKLKSKNKNAHPIQELIDVMAALRDPDGGCPWDLEQNFKSIAPYTIEEAYEVHDAIARGNMDDLREELGDLLLQPVYHAQMASEEGLFNIEDVIREVTQKMISRHPHVFGEDRADNPEDVNNIWDKQKAQENKGENDSALDGVPKSFPALLRAQKLQKKAAKVGFEWPAFGDVLDKLEEEISELREAIQDGSLEKQSEEFGDMLFVLVNFARMLGVNSETALREANDKFERRFRGLEEDFKKEGKGLTDASLDQMLQMWVRQKSKER